MAVERISDGKCEHDEGAGEHEEQPCDKPAHGAVQPPADISRKLHGFGAGQQHAEIERAKELVLADPAMLIHQHAVHQRDLTGWAAERQDADLRPDGECFFEGRSNALAFDHAALVPDSVPCRNDSMSACAQT